MSLIHSSEADVLLSTANAGFQCFVVKMWPVFESRVGGSLQGLSGLSPSVCSECQRIPRSPRDLAGVILFTLNWMTNPTNMIVNILKAIP